MRSLASVVDWWEEWQLRILVLGSLAIQLHLAIFAPYRKWPNLKLLYRLFIWLAYLGGDALAIYALATLFNRQKKLQYLSSSVNDGGSHDLEVLWAPILLMHLGGRMTISAYNIEDNELWLRHIGVAVSQVAVTVYVFWKSWSHSADKRLLAAAILLFILGIVRCFEKPLALKRSSFNNLVTYFSRVPRTGITINREVDLERYIQDAKVIVMQSSNKQQQQQEPASSGEAAGTGSRQQSHHMEKLSVPDRLFVDYAYDYNARLKILESLWLLGSEETFVALCKGLSETFNLIYTKIWRIRDERGRKRTCVDGLSANLYSSTMTFPIASIVLFHISHKQAYRGSDIKVTYLLLYITYFSEIISAPIRLFILQMRSSSRRMPNLAARICASLHRSLGLPLFSAVVVAKHSLIQVLSDKIRCPILVHVPDWCLVLLGKHTLGRSYDSTTEARDIMDLVRAHVRDGWMNYIGDVESYWKFSDLRGHGTLERNGNACQQIAILRDSVEKPLDESIILWHLATDFCFHLKAAESVDSKSVSFCASMCRCISYYMMHLLSTNPEMLLPGSRPALFEDACEELDAVPKWSAIVDEKQVMEKVIQHADKSQDGFLHDAWLLAQGLMQLAGDDDGEKMWQVIRGVWIEMLCFSAFRCRGYLHAKSLAYGGEFLTVVSLLMSHAGLETFAERQQRVQLRLPTEERVQKVNQVTVEKEVKIRLGEENAAATPSSASASTSSPAMEVVVVPS